MFDSLFRRTIQTGMREEKVREIQKEGRELEKERESWETVKKIGREKEIESERKRKQSKK